jgi:ABC-type uncharacterized transport system substrate-binding protein
MGIAADALAAGLVKSNARPGGNITGMILGRIEQTAKGLELLKQAFPEVTVVTVRGANLASFRRGCRQEARDHACSARSSQL